MSDRFQHSECMVNKERVGENIACSWSSAGADYTGRVHSLALGVLAEEKREGWGGRERGRGRKREREERERGGERERGRRGREHRLLLVQRRGRLHR